MGLSALASFSVFVILTPIQSKFMKSLFRTQCKTMEWTDKRAKLLQELLEGMKLIKLFAWEVPFLKHIAGFRQRELRQISFHARFVWTLDLTDLLPQLRTDNITASGNEHGISHLHSGYGICCSSSHIRRFWTSTTARSDMIGPLIATFMHRQRLYISSADYAEISNYLL